MINIPKKDDVMSDVLILEWKFINEGNSKVMLTKIIEKLIENDEKLWLEYKSYWYWNEVDSNLNKIWFSWPLQLWFWVVFNSWPLCCTHALRQRFVLRILVYIVITFWFFDLWKCLTVFQTSRNNCQCPWNLLPCAIDRQPWISAQFTVIIRQTCLFGAYCALIIAFT